MHRFSPRTETPCVLVEFDVREGVTRWGACGWKVEHDVQRDGRANLDHIVTGPACVFLLETKNLNGTVTFENDVLVARQFDDPDEVYRLTTLAPRLRGQAKELSALARKPDEESG